MLVWLLPGVLVSDDFKQQFPQTLNANISGITTSSFLLGAFVGSICAFVLGDRLGRKKTIAWGLLFNFLGAVLQAVAWHLPQMIVGRVLNGFGMGLTSTMTPVFLSECAKAHQRGKLVVIGASSNVTAFALANWISYALYFQDGPLQWRFPLALQLLFPLVIGPLLFFVSESPRWLLLVNREKNALQVIARMASSMTTVEEPAVIAEFRSIKAAIQLEREHRAPLLDVLCFRDKTHNFRRLLLSCGTQLMQQFSGINALGKTCDDLPITILADPVGFYLPTLLVQNVGFNQEMSRMLSAVSGTVYLVAAFCSLVIIDRFGRRKMMLYGAITMGLCHIIASLCLKTSDEDISRRKIMGNVTTAMFIIYHVFFGTSFSSVPWVYSAEVNSLGWRTRGAAAATATNWIGGFAVTQFTKVGVDRLGWAFYLSEL
ncbi:hypothetical protein DL769_005930 [Monosporascus sp. CRB-8-3]|nr:hypothetical protein DL769_005930 [Monosporascus sp. CRB-8-3]